MSVPGLQLTEVTDTITEKTHQIAPNTEWRFEVAHGSTIEVKLLHGSAEIFGTELPQGTKYTFSGTKSAIFTWTGCTIHVSGSPTVEYTAEETPMSTYANIHFALEKLRGKADEQGQQGPRAMIIGPENAGKTSLAKLLTGYATRQGSRPVVVNLDPKEGMLSLPGTISAATYATVLDVEQGWGASPTSGPNPVPAKTPLVYYYGLEQPDGNEKLYRKLAARMALAVSSKMADDPLVRASGCIIDTPGLLSTPGGYDLVQHIVAEYQVDTLIVLGSERLYSDMVRKFEERQHNPITVVKLQKSGGCVDRDEAFMKQSRENAIREYFFGEAKRTLSPYTLSVNFDEMSVWNVGQVSNVGAELLPAGEEHAQPLYSKTEPSAQLQHSLLAVLHAEWGDNEQVLAESTVMGFVYVASVDDAKRFMKVLAPVSGRLPQRPLVVSTFPEPTFSLVG